MHTLFPFLFDYVLWALRKMLELAQKFGEAQPQEICLAIREFKTWLSFMSQTRNHEVTEAEILSDDLTAELQTLESQLRRQFGPSTHYCRRLKGRRKGTAFDLSVSDTLLHCISYTLRILGQLQKRYRIRTSGIYDPSLLVYLAQRS